MTIAVLGEALIDLIVSEDGAYRPHLGGSPFNVAIGLARQGVAVSYHSPLSDDVLGDQLNEALQREGVSTPIRRRSRFPTSLALVTVDDAGSAAYRLYREGVADIDWSPDEVESSLPDDLRVLHTGSLAIAPDQLPKIRQIMASARDKGAMISLDINIRMGACRDSNVYLDGVRSLLPLADIVKASDEDIEPFGLSNNVRDAAQQLYAEMSAGMFVLTEGQEGASIYAESGVVEQAAFAVANVGDTVGAGDTFHAALLASLCRGGAIGQPIEALGVDLLAAALQFASAAAAVNVSRVGCNPPTRREVEAFIARAQAQ